MESKDLSGVLAWVEEMNETREEYPWRVVEMTSTV
jgi:hypothetical protein